MAKQSDNIYGNFDSFEQFFEQAEQQPGYWIELAKLDFTREVFEQMKVQRISKGDLAAKLGAQPPLVTRLLSGRNNFELATMVKLARALDCEFRCHLQPRGAKTRWIDVLDEAPARQPAAAWNPSEFETIKFEPKVLSHESVPAAA